MSNISINHKAPSKPVTVRMSCLVDGLPPLALPPADVEVLSRYRGFSEAIVAPDLDVGAEGVADVPHQLRQPVGLVLASGTGHPAATGK